MDLLIKAKDLFLEYNGREILSIDQLEIYQYERIGLVGSNGVGKSTLMKLLLGNETVSGCNIFRFGELTYIPQLDNVTMSEKQNYALMRKLSADKVDMQVMSGGEETKLKIAQAFSGQVHGIFADEPTYHLDSMGIQLLIEQLKVFSGALLIISHDRYFLDEVVDKIWELKDGKIFEYWGNYSDYLKQKEEKRKHQTVMQEQFMAEKKRLMKAMDERQKQAEKIDKKEVGKAKKYSKDNPGRLGYSKSEGSKQKSLYKAAKNIEHRISNLENHEAPETIRMIRFRQSEALELHNPFPIMGDEICKSFGNRIIFDHASFRLPLSAKVALTGGNGTGKTTLFQMILNHADSIRISPKVQIGYFDQTAYKHHKNQKVMEFMQENCDYQVSEIRSVLASMGLSQNDIQNNLSVLSGGELIKLHLSKLLLGRYNVLLLDEPGNFLDLPSIEGLELLMKQYKGTIFFITHDKHLQEHVADQILVIEDKKIMIKN